jgi:hypothetical protein
VATTLFEMQLTMGTTHAITRVHVDLQVLNTGWKKTGQGRGGGSHWDREREREKMSSETL